MEAALWSRGPCVSPVTLKGATRLGWEMSCPRLRPPRAQRRSFALVARPAAPVGACGAGRAGRPPGSPWDRRLPSLSAVSLGCTTVGSQGGAGAGDCGGEERQGRRQAPARDPRCRPGPALVTGFPLWNSAWHPQQHFRLDPRESALPPSCPGGPRLLGPPNHDRVPSYQRVAMGSGVTPHPCLVLGAPTSLPSFRGAPWD